jgi:hypothetical protein
VVGDFVKGAIAFLQQAFGCLDPDVLLIDQRGFPGGGFKSPFQSTTAHTVFTGQVVIIKVFVEIFFDPLLDR